MPGLIAKLAAPPAGDDREVYAVRAALLDAAVRLDAAVPASVVRSYWNDFPVQSAILFPRATAARDGVLLDLLTSATDFRWFALANLLVQWRAGGLTVSPNGLAVNILTPLHLNLVVTVSEQGHAGSGGGGGGGVGDGIGINPAGFPPRATYRFESGPLAGLTVLSTGPRVVYYSRTVSYGWQFGVSEVSIGGPTGAERLRYLQAYAFLSASRSTTSDKSPSGTNVHGGKAMTRCDDVSITSAPTCVKSIATFSPRLSLEAG